MDDWSERRALAWDAFALAALVTVVLAAGWLVAEAVAWLVGECRG